MRLTFFTIMGYRYTENREYLPSNDKLNKETKQTPWSVKIAKRRLTCMCVCFIDTKYILIDVL